MMPGAFMGPTPIRVGMRPVARPMPAPSGIEPTMTAMPHPVGPARPILGTFHKGGKVKKSGAYKLLKGEKVLSLADLKKAKK